MTDTDEQIEVQLRDGIDRVVRSGVVLEADETTEAYPDILEDHGDVLERVDDQDDGTEEDS